MNLRINTAISKLIVLNNHLTSLDAAPRDAHQPLVLGLAHLLRTCVSCGVVWATRIPSPVSARSSSSSLLVEGHCHGRRPGQRKGEGPHRGCPLDFEEGPDRCLAEADRQGHSVAQAAQVIARVPKLVNVVVQSGPHEGDAVVT